MSKILAFIGARKGSKGLPNKNIRDFAGSPLINWTFKAATESKYITEIFVSTDSDEILKNLSHNFSYSTDYVRPTSLSADETTIIDTVNHGLAWLAERGLTYEHVILLQPTSPLRTTKDIDSSITKYFSSNKHGRTLVSVYELPRKIFWLMKGSEENIEFINSKNEIGRRQDLKDHWYLPNGAIYIASVLENKVSTFFGESIIPHVMPEEYSTDIDTIEDFLKAEDFFYRLKKS